MGDPTRELLLSNKKRTRIILIFTLIVTSVVVLLGGLIGKLSRKHSSSPDVNSTSSEVQ